MQSFETKSLIGFPLKLGEYASFKAGLEPKWEGFTNPYKHLVEGPSPLIYRIPKVEQSPGFAEIGLILGILKSTKEIVGSAGFLDFPDKNGMIEIGFGIVPQMQNKGYGLELLIGMWKMISKRDDVKILRYTVSPENKPSMHIINKLGFNKIGEQIDPVDGLEFIYEKSIAEFILTLNNFD